MEEIQYTEKKGWFESMSVPLIIVAALAFIALFTGLVNYFTISKYTEATDNSITNLGDSLLTEFNDSLSANKKSNKQAITSLQDRMFLYLAGTEAGAEIIAAAIETNLDKFIKSGSTGTATTKECANNLSYGLLVPFESYERQARQYFLKVLSSTTNMNVLWNKLQLPLLEKLQAQPAEEQALLVQECETISAYFTSKQPTVLVKNLILQDLQYEKNGYEYYEGSSDENNPLVELRKNPQWSDDAEYYTKLTLRFQNRAEAAGNDGEQWLKNAAEKLKYIAKELSSTASVPAATVDDNISTDDPIPAPVKKKSSAWDDLG